MAIVNGETEAKNEITSHEQKDALATTNDGDVEQQDDGPAGGFDETPIPPPPPGTIGYTLRVTIHQATNLLMGDAHVFSSDPYVVAQINTNQPTRHREDPKLRFRSRTVHRSTDPEWNNEWIIANAPSTGFKLKFRVYDEDPADHDDLLGKVHITIPNLDDDWKGYKMEPFPLKLRDSSKRAVLIRAAAKALRVVHDMRGELCVSVQIIERTPEDGQNGRLYTVGPLGWVQHYSPILGRIANIKQPGENKKSEEEPPASSDGKSQKEKKKAERYNFQANQMQLPGPIPADLYHRFVEFKPWVERMFTTKGVQGVVLGKALHHQHMRVYNFGRSTIWGELPDSPSKEFTKKFLELVHWDRGGRIFTYVLTLDALWRFTETGEEFGIDMLSKHTMHSDVSIYIAFSGEFFIRRNKKCKRQQHPDDSISATTTDTTSANPSQGGSDPPADQTLQPPHPDDSTDTSQDPSNYTLIIDNDSGTYRPSAAHLPSLAAYLSRCLPGLQVRTLDCQADADEMNKLKTEQRDRKKEEGDGRVYAQVSDSSSISSSDEEALDGAKDGWNEDRKEGSAREKEGHEEEKWFKTVGRDWKQEQGQRLEKLVRNAKGGSRDGVDGDGL